MNTLFNWLLSVQWWHVTLICIDFFPGSVDGDVSLSAYQGECEPEWETYNAGCNPVTLSEN